MAGKIALKVAIKVGKEIYRNYTDTNSPTAIPLETLRSLIKDAKRNADQNKKNKYQSLLDVLENTEGVEDGNDI